MTENHPRAAESIQAISFDFYQTLAFHREGIGRGAAVMEYLRLAGLESDPWEHQILYDIFDRHLVEYEPGATAPAKLSYQRQLAVRLFNRMSVRGADPADHAVALWAILGPSSLALFPETIDVLERIRDSGLPMVIISNWQNCLRHFCDELGIAEFFDEIFVSAEEGYQKPDARIFEKACLVIGKDRRNVIHVGDSMIDDFEGGRASGLQVLLIEREGPERDPEVPTLCSLCELLPTLGLD